MDAVLPVGCSDLVVVLPYLTEFGSFAAFQFVVGGGEADARPDGDRLAGIMLRGDLGLFVRLPSGVEFPAVVGGSANRQYSVIFTPKVRRECVIIDFR